MKLLIADDEKLTREGICSLLDLKQYGITEVILADDGVNALTEARKHRPDILLTDVRMPPHDWGLRWLLCTWKRLRIQPSSS